MAKLIKEMIETLKGKLPKEELAKVETDLTEILDAEAKMSTSLKDANAEAKASREMKEELEGKVKELTDSNETLKTENEKLKEDTDDDDDKKKKIEDDPKFKALNEKIEALTNLITKKDTDEKKTKQGDYAFQKVTELLKKAKLPEKFKDNVKYDIPEKATNEEIDKLVENAVNGFKQIFIDEKLKSSEEPAGGGGGGSVEDDEITDFATQRNEERNKSEEL